MPDGTNGVSRRDILKYSGGVGGTSLLGSTAGCMSSLTGGGDGGEFESEAEKIGFAENWKQRRLTSLDEWPLEKRQAIPDEGNLTSIDAWKNSEAIQSAPWSLPEGWKDTAAADVDTLQVLNFGSLEYDPATAATYAMFENATGIDIEPLEIVVDQAVPKEAAFLSAREQKPHAFLVTVGSSLTSFVGNGYLQQTNPVMSEDEMWSPYLDLAKNNFRYNGNTYLSPNINEGSLVHYRPDLMREQGVDDSTLTRIEEGSYTWDDMETVMEAFKGTDVAGWAYRGASLVYTARDWMKMFYQAGGRIVQDDGTVKFNSEPGVVALEKMVEWRENGLVPKGVTNFTQGDLADGFLSGQFAMVPVFGDLVPRAVEEFGGDGERYRPTVQPKGGSDAPSPTRAGIATPTGFGINAFTTTGHKLAAMLYQDARWSQASAWFEFVVEGNQCYVSDVYKEAKQTDAALYSGIRGRAVKNNVSEIFPQQRVVRQKVSEELQIALAGNKEPKKALDDVQEYVNTVLSQG